MDQLIFLGTGGGRFSMITQKRRTGGIRLIGSSNIQIDPGPGSIAYSHQLNIDPSKVDSLLISHCHPDHDNDAEIYIEAMTNGGTKKRGTLIAPKGVIEGNAVCDVRISNYHRNQLSKVIKAEIGKRIILENLEIEVVTAKHEDPDAVGYKLSLESIDLGYTSDTEYFSGLGSQFKGVDILLVCVLRPRGVPIKGHLCTDEVIKILDEAKPKLCVLTGFGIRMIYANPDREAKFVEQISKIKTIAARDNMMLKLGEHKIQDNGEGLSRFLN
ncbi:MBL fold metallo-hydrolase [[Eubacterium] cellulosolvens]